MDNTVKGFQTNEGTKQYDYNALANLPTLISQDDVNGVVVNALEQAKQNGDFKGDKGDDYILTEADKVEIAEMAAELIDTPDNPGGGDIDLDGYATQQWVQDQNYLTSIPSEYITSTELTSAVDSALEQAKANGDFKGEPGEPGDDYILTSSDKNEIADIVLGQIEIPDSPGGGGTTDLTGYATEEWVKKQNYLTSIPSDYVTSNELTNEVNSALTQAKENGDFKGDKGDKGATFFPQIDSQGNLSWTNDSDLDNPTTINITGPKGETPQKGVDYYTKEDKDELIQEILNSLPIAEEAKF